MARVRTAVLISGSGNNLQALIDAARDPDFPAEIVLVVSNRVDAYGLERAQAAGIAAKIIDHKQFQNRADFDAALDRHLRQANIALICLAGFMRLLTADFVAGWRDRLMNIHPSLLPAFPGLNVHQRAIDSGARFSGCTVHLVRAETDSGPILAQAVVPIHQDDTAQSLAMRILVQEHRIYPFALRLMAAGHVTIKGDRAFIRTVSAPTQAMINPDGRMDIGV